MTTPFWLLLVWAGLAATVVAAAAGRLLGPRTPRAWSLAPLPPSAAHALGASLALGLFAYPLVYGAVFEGLHRSDVRLGALLGAVHATAAFAFAIRRAETRVALRNAAMHFVYGVTIAFLYVTP